MRESSEAVGSGARLHPLKSANPSQQAQVQSSADCSGQFQAEPGCVLGLCWINGACSGRPKREREGGQVLLELAVGWEDSLKEVEPKLSFRSRQEAPG